MQLNGAEIVIECLKEQGVDTIFGYPGGAILNVYDELYKHRDEIRHILTSHEQGASHAADGYARATGKVGVCLATSGPGATNLVTGIATAYMDSIPVVAITCNVGVSLLGKDSFQEIDITGITMPITKYSFIVKDVAELADTIRKAFRIAKSGRPGPVLVDIPKDVTAAVTEYERQELGKYVPEHPHINEEKLRNILSMLEAAKKPYVFVGGGAVLSGASDELKEFVDKLDAPVTDTLMGKGAFPGTDPRYTGMSHSFAIVWKPVFHFLTAFLVPSGAMARWIFLALLTSCIRLTISDVGLFLSTGMAPSARSMAPNGHQKNSLAIMTYAFPPTDV